MVVVWVDNKNEEIVERSVVNDPWHPDTQHADALDVCSLGGLSVNAWLGE
jgi:hypothetical protein